MDKLERKFGKYAIKNLPLILIVCYGIGYLLYAMGPEINGRHILLYLTLDPAYILEGQVWRLVSWLLIPPTSFDFFTIIMLLFYYSISRTLDQVWGSFKFNVYIFSGIIFTILGSFVLYGIFNFFPELFPLASYQGMFFSTFYINMSIFLAFAATFPDNMVLLMFIFPVKIKWLGIAYAIILGFDVVNGPLSEKVVIIMSLLNFIIFFFTFRKKFNQSIRAKFAQAQRRRNFERQYNQDVYGRSNANTSGASRAYGTNSPSSGGFSAMSKHRCAICGRTEQDNPDLQFRFCSKCNGNYEYCNDHLFTHTHVE